MSIIAGFINRASTLPKNVRGDGIHQPAQGARGRISSSWGNIVFWVVVAAFGIWVVGKFITNISSLHHQEV